MVYKIFNLTFNIEQFKMLVKDQLFYRMTSGEVYFSNAFLVAVINSTGLNYSMTLT